MSKEVQKLSPVLPELPSYQSRGQVRGCIYMMSRSSQKTEQQETALLVDIS